MGILQDQVVIVTGAGSGLGRATACLLAKEGAAVVICGRRKHKLEESALQIIEAGGRALPIQADISREEQVKSLFDEIGRRFGRVDALINNAGVFEAGSVLDTALESWNYQLSVNLTGAFLMIREALPFMRAQKYGRIVNITSGLAVNGAGGYAAYSASKAGLESLTRTVAEEESEYGIIANLFNPGTIRSEMHATGKDPLTVAPGIVRLASLPRGSASGRLYEADAIDAMI
jgi:NAD(P)-dependent dehydrogenase (short-subunit alcohol dehydrogenase family)